MPCEGIPNHTKQVRSSLQELPQSGFMGQTSKLLVHFLMQITRATDYALRVMVQLAMLPDGQKMQLHEVSAVAGVRGTFLSKILQRLVHQGLVSSHRGTGGGFCLKASPEKVTLLQVVESMEGPIQLNVCLGAGPACEHKSRCNMHPVWRNAQSALAAELGRVSIAELARETASNLNRDSDTQLIQL